VPIQQGGWKCPKHPIRGAVSERCIDSDKRKSQKGEEEKTRVPAIRENQGREEETNRRGGQFDREHTKASGKIGKKVEFGMLWGVERLGGGFVLGRMKRPEESLHDTKYVLEAVETHKRLFVKAPHSYGYDRGGYRKKIPENQRKGQGRGKHRNNLREKIWIQSTWSTQVRNDGSLWTAGDSWPQLKQSGSVNCKKRKNRLGILTINQRLRPHPHPNPLPPDGRGSLNPNFIV